jgi:hypothetical protein
MSNTAPAVNHNFGVNGDVGTLADVEIVSSILDFHDPEQPDTLITYTISSVSPYGSLLKNGVTLGVGDSFTQHDINHHHVSFSSLYVGTVSDQIGFVVSDGAGGQVGSALQFTIVDNSIHPPEISIAGSAAYTEGHAAAILSPAAALSHWDTDTISSFKIVLDHHVAGDVLSADTAGTGIHSSYDAASGTLSLTGADTVQHYASVLQTVLFSSASDDPSSGGTRPSSALEWIAPEEGISAASTLSVAAVNDAPVNAAPAMALVEAGASVSLGALSVADADAGTGTLTITLSVNHGALVAAGDAAGAGINGNGSADLVLSGTVAALNTTLAHGITYTPLAGFVGADLLSFATHDGGHTGEGGTLIDVDAVAITVVAAAGHADKNGAPAQDWLPDDHIPFPSEAQGGMPPEWGSATLPVLILPAYPDDHPVTSAPSVLEDPCSVVAFAMLPGPLCDVVYSAQQGYVLLS